MELVEKQKEILKFLKKEGEQPEGRIAFQISSNTSYTKYYLEELMKLNLVSRKIQIGSTGTTRGTYWKLTEEGEKWV